MPADHLQSNTAPPWTCPFCALHCDGFQAVPQGDVYRLEGTDCPRAHAALSRFAVTPGPAPAPTVDGVAATLEEALGAAAARLAQARLPLFGGLASDIQGCRSLYALADAAGAILDHAYGDAQMNGVRALQDRGLITTTLAEVRERADLVVCLGSQPGARYPELYTRCGLNPGTAESGLEREVVFVDTGIDPRLVPGQDVQAGSVRGGRDLFETVALLGALVSGRTLREAAPADLAALAQRLLAARYAVLVWDMVGAPAHGALLAQGLHRLVDTLNRKSRAAALLLGGNDGAMSANQAVTWMSGLPLRTGVLPRGLTHEPVAFAASRLLQQRAVDALLWVSSFGPEPAVPATDLPAVVLGHPDHGAAANRKGCVFIPVTTPGIGGSAHLARFDSVVVLPLRPLRADGLPSVTDIARQLEERVRLLRRPRVLAVAGVSA